MKLDWLNPENPDPHDIASAAALMDAANDADSPFLPGPTVSSLTADIRHGWDGDPARVALVRDDKNRACAVLEAFMPSRDNTHLGSVHVTVDPLLRRKGLGRAIFAAGVELIRSAGRNVVLAECYDRPEFVEFVKAMGLEPASQAACRRHLLAELDRDRLEEMYAEALPHANAYELLRMRGETPPELLSGIAEMTAAINDAPTDDLDIEDEVYTPERIRAFDIAQRARGRRIYRVVARERATDALAGHTVVAVESERPGWGWQFDTSVMRPHRGHRLGLVLKAEMLRWLAEEEPQLRIVDTWNATSNSHMIRVNEALGYRLCTTSSVWQRRL